MYFSYNPHCTHLPTQPNTPTDIPSNHHIATRFRKTFGYVQGVAFGVGFDVLCKRFNHSSPAITMRYLGIQDKEVNGILMNDI